MDPHISKNQLLGFSVSILIVLLLNLLKQVIKLQKINKSLTETNSLNKEVLTVFSHDIKEALIIFRELSKDLQSGKIDQLSFCNSINFHSTAVSGIVDNLFQWSSVELNPSVTIYSEESLNQQIRWIIESMKVQCQQKQIKIVNRVQNHIYWNINFCVFEIAVRNLISNSIKFSEKGSEILITYSNNQLHIKDFGIGIPAKQIATLFERKLRSFYGSIDEKGYGIGLILVHDVLKRHGFQLEASSEEGKGAVFSIKNIRNTHAKI